MNEQLNMKYFVLNPNKKDVFGEASRAAIRAYGMVIREQHPEFADDLAAWLREIEEK